MLCKFLEGKFRGGWSDELGGGWEEIGWMIEAKNFHP